MGILDGRHRNQGGRRNCEIRAASRNRTEDSAMTHGPGGDDDQGHARETSEDDPGISNEPLAREGAGSRRLEPRFWARPHQHWRHGCRDNRGRHWSGCRAVHAKPIRNLVAAKIRREWPSIGHLGGSAGKPPESKHQDRAIDVITQPLDRQRGMCPVLIVYPVHLAAKLLDSILAPGASGSTNVPAGWTPEVLSWTTLHNLGQVPSWPFAEPATRGSTPLATPLTRRSGAEPKATASR
jgi:hypothetical protein